jgi:signal transduction histidine kinase
VIAAETERRARWPWIVLAFFFALAIAGTILVAVNRESLAEQVTYVIAFTMFGVVGALLSSRARGKRIGGLLLYGATTTATAFAAGELMTYLVRHGVSEGFAVVAAAILSNLGWLIGIIPVLVFLPLLFPDGRLPSRRWIPLVWFDVATIAFFLVGGLLGERTLTGSWEGAVVANPLYVSALPDIHLPDAVFELLLLGVLVGSVVSLVVRFRRSAGVERQQIKWVTLAVVLLVVSFIATSVLLALGVSTFIADSLVGGLAFLSVPVAIGIAVLQFHLYDLDVVVKKTLVAGAFALLVIAVYGTVVGLYGLFASGRESAGSLFVVALLLGLAFRPVARFARRVADRIVYGKRATPYEVLTEFSERVGESYATEDVLRRMAEILGQAVGAAGARVWLRVGGELRPAASWPSDTPAAGSVSVRGDRLPDLGETAFEVRDRGELLGALSVTMPANDPLNPAKERLVRDLASQAGLVLRNVGLVEELRASQRRLVSAQDEERRRLERNIHDGAQQQLVALSVKTRLARAMAARDVGKADEMLAQIDVELQAALEDLRDLARGIYPPLLADKGLGAALEAQARRSPVPIRVQAPGIGRYPQDVEAAVYFSCLEALQNVTKYADANAVTVTIAQSNGHLTFEVVDDGRGFEPDAASYGTGLQGIADRLAALDGELAVSSRPGEGTAVVGSLAIPT